jgi:hypothetical protein
MNKLNSMDEIGNFADFMTKKHLAEEAGCQALILLFMSNRQYAGMFHAASDFVNVATALLTRSTIVWRR